MRRSSRADALVEKEVMGIDLAKKRKDVDFDLDSDDDVFGVGF